MNIRTAILKAADHIEANPQEFDFNMISVPGCGMPGCALGWICFFMGEKPGDAMWYEKFGMPDSRVFYQRMNEVTANPRWTASAPECARGLRLYADKYHPEGDQPATQSFAEIMADARCGKVPNEGELRVERIMERVLGGAK